jgi:hypothetical protein
MENVAAVHPYGWGQKLPSLPATNAKRLRLEASGSRECAPDGSQMTEGQTPLPSRPKFQAFQTGRDIEADLALHAERL